MALACHDTCTTCLEVPPFPHYLHTIVQNSVLLGLLVSVRVGSSQARGDGGSPEGRKGRPRKTWVKEHCTRDPYS